MVASVYELVRTFATANKLTEDIWPAWKQEFAFLFAELDLLGHIQGTDPRPATAGKDQDAFDTVDRWARIALYSTIASARIRSSHIKPEGTKGQTSRTIWTSLVAEFEGDSRSARITHKRALYTPVHDAEKPIAEYINGIINAADALAALQHPVPTHDVVDSIIMNLDDGWSLIRTLLVSQKTEPDLTTVKTMLQNHERDHKLLETEPEAHAVRRGGYSRTSRKPAHRGRSASRTAKYDWLNTKNRDACHRCGLPGHRSSRCIADMPDDIKDKVMAEVRQRSDDRAHSRSRSRSRSPHRHQAHHVWAASDTEGEAEEELSEGEQAAMLAAFSGGSGTFDIVDEGDNIVSIHPARSHSAHHASSHSGRSGNAHRGGRGRGSRRKVTRLEI